MNNPDLPLKTAAIIKHGYVGAPHSSVPKVLFRFHRGSLQESMSTVVSITSFSDLREHLITSGNYSAFPSPLIIELTHDGYDELIKWDSYLVSLIDTKGRRFAVGFTNGLLVEEELKVVKNNP